MYTKRHHPSASWIAVVTVTLYMSHAVTLTSGFAIHPQHTTNDNCTDHSEWCPKWAGNDREGCLANPTFMYSECEKSCGRCCQDKEDGRICFAWVRSGQCKSNPTFMAEQCAKSCNMCDKQGSAGAPTNSHDPKVNISGCQDKSGSQVCSVWANKGECKSNPIFMYSQCAKSCRMCEGPAKAAALIAPTDDISCQDKAGAQTCANWAAVGECKHNPAWMETHCRRSCALCANNGELAEGTKVESLQGQALMEAEEPCLDTSTNCPRWAAMGECQANAVYMYTTCRRACMLCHDSPLQNSTEAAPKAAAATGAAAVTSPAADGGCHDNYPDCAAWAKNGECKKNGAWMTAECGESCDMCHKDALSPGDTPGLDPKACKDKHPSCPEWAATDECDKNTKVMHASCPVSCGLCGDHVGRTASFALVGNPNCEDRSPNCPAWAANGECKTNPEFMIVECAHSCAADSSPSCPKWAAQGDCETNKSYMSRYCAKSCKTCGSATQHEEL